MTPSKWIPKISTKQVSMNDDKNDPLLLMKKCLFQTLRVETDNINYIMKGRASILLSELPDWFHSNSEVYNMEYNPNVCSESFEVNDDCQDLKIVRTFSLATEKREGSGLISGSDEKGMQQQNEKLTVVEVPSLRPSETPSVSEDDMNQSSLMAANDITNVVPEILQVDEKLLEVSMEEQKQTVVKDELRKGTDVRSVFSCSALDQLLDKETEALKQKENSLLLDRFIIKPTDIKYETPLHQTSYVKTLQTALEEREKTTGFTSSNGVLKKQGSEKSTYTKTSASKTVSPAKIPVKKFKKEAPKRTFVLKPTYNLSRVRNCLQKSFSSKVKKNIFCSNNSPGLPDNLCKQKKWSFMNQKSRSLLQTITLSSADFAVSALYVVGHRHKLVKYEDHLVNQLTNLSTKNNLLQSLPLNLPKSSISNHNIRKRIKHSLLPSSAPSFKKRKLNFVAEATKTLHFSQTCMLVTITRKIAKFAVTALNVSKSKECSDNKPLKIVSPPVPAEASDDDDDNVVISPEHVLPLPRQRSCNDDATFIDIDAIPEAISSSSLVEDSLNVENCVKTPVICRKPLNPSYVKTLHKTLKSLRPMSLSVIFYKHLVYQAKLYKRTRRISNYQTKHFHELPVVLKRGLNSEDSWKLRVVKHKMRWGGYERDGQIVMFPTVYKTPENIDLFKPTSSNTETSLTCARSRVFVKKKKKKKKKKSYHIQKCEWNIDSTPRSTIGKVEKGIMIVRFTRRSNNDRNESILGKILSMCTWSDQAEEIINLIIKSHSELQIMQRGKYLCSMVGEYKVEVLKVPLDRIIASLEKGIRNELKSKNLQWSPLVKITWKPKTKLGSFSDRSIDFAKAMYDILELDRLLNSFSKLQGQKIDMRCLEVGDIDPFGKSSESGKYSNYAVPSFVKVSATADATPLRLLDKEPKKSCTSNTSGISARTLCSIERPKKFEVGKIGCLHSVTAALKNTSVPRKPVFLPPLPVLLPPPPDSDAGKKFHTTVKEPSSIMKSPTNIPLMDVNKSNSFPSLKNAIKNMDDDKDYIVIPIKVVSSSEVNSPCLVMCTPANTPDPTSMQCILPIPRSSTLSQKFELLNKVKNPMKQAACIKCTTSTSSKQILPTNSCQVLQNPTHEAFPINDLQFVMTQEGSSKLGTTSEHIVVNTSLLPFVNKNSKTLINTPVPRHKLFKLRPKNLNTITKNNNCASGLSRHLITSVNITTPSVLSQTVSSNYGSTLPNSCHSTTADNPSSVSYLNARYITIYPPNHLLGNTSTSQSIYTSPRTSQLSVYSLSSLTSQSSVYSSPQVTSPSPVYSLPSLTLQSSVNTLQLPTTSSTTWVTANRDGGKSKCVKLVMAVPLPIPTIQSAVMTPQTQVCDVTKPQIVQSSENMKIYKHLHPTKTQLNSTIFNAFPVTSLPGARIVRTNEKFMVIKPPSGKMRMSKLLNPVTNISKCRVQSISKCNPVVSEVCSKTTAPASVDNSSTLADNTALNSSIILTNESTARQQSNDCSSIVKLCSGAETTSPSVCITTSTSCIQHPEVSRSDVTQVELSSSGDDGVIEGSCEAESRVNPPDITDIEDVTEMRNKDAENGTDLVGGGISEETNLDIVSFDPTVSSNSISHEQDQSINYLEEDCGNISDLDVVNWSDESSEESSHMKLLQQQHNSHNRDQSDASSCDNVGKHDVNISQPKNDDDEKIIISEILQQQKMKSSFRQDRKPACKQQVLQCRNITEKFRRKKLKKGLLELNNSLSQPLQNPTVSAVLKKAINECKILKDERATLTLNRRYLVKLNSDMKEKLLSLEML